MLAWTVAGKYFPQLLHVLNRCAKEGEHIVYTDSLIQKYRGRMAELDAVRAYVEADRAALGELLLPNPCELRDVLARCEAFTHSTEIIEKQGKCIDMTEERLAPL